MARTRTDGLAPGLAIPGTLLSHSVMLSMGPAMPAIITCDAQTALRRAVRLGCVPGANDRASALCNRAWAASAPECDSLAPRMMHMAWLRSENVKSSRVDSGLGAMRASFRLTKQVGV